METMKINIQTQAVELQIHKITNKFNKDTI